MTAATADLDTYVLDDDFETPAAREQRLVAYYRSLSFAERRRYAFQASPEVRARLAYEEQQITMDRSPGGLAAILTEGRELQAPHLNMIDRVFQRIANGERLQVMLTCPPRHGKSQRASRWGPLWYLRRHPTHRVMIASYGAELADDHGRWVRDYLKEYTDLLGIRLNPASHAANRFDLEAPRGSSVRGGMVTAGVGGGLTGKGFNLGIIDDPFKGNDDSGSPAQRDRVYEWYRSVFYTRRAPGASLILINTRWHEDDLSGRLLAHEPHRWIQIDLPAIADSPNDPLGRQLGQALWPSQYDEKELADTRESLGERIWYAMYQQKPRPLEGGVWKWAWITGHRLDPKAWPGKNPTRIVVAVDHAGGDSLRNDEVGLCCTARDSDGHYYVLDDRSRTMGADTWGTEVCRLAIERQADAIVVENNFGGDMAKQIVTQAWNELAREGETKGMLMPAIIEVHAKQGKRLRAEPIAQLYSRGLVHHVGEFVELEGQMVTWVPGMDSPDRMDAAVHALTELANPAAAATGSRSYADHRLSGRR